MLKRLILVILAICNLPVITGIEVSAEDVAGIDEVYIAERFENGSGGFSVVEKTVDGVKSTVSIIESGGNNYLFFKKNTNAGDCYADFALGTTRSEIVVEFDMKMNNFGTNAMPLYIRDTSTSPYGEWISDWALIITPEGVLKSKNGSFQMTELGWIHVYLFFDLDSKTYSVKVGNTFIDENSEYSSLDIHSLDVLRVYAGEGVGNMCIDNLLVYSGTKERNITDEETVLGARRAAAKSDNYSRVFLKDKAAVHSESARLFSGGTDGVCKVLPYTEGDEIFVCPQDFMRLCGMDISEQADSFTVGDTVFLKDSYAAYRGDNRYIMDYPVKMMGDIYMLPLAAMCEVLGKYVCTDQCGLFIVSDSDISAQEDIIKEIGCYMFFNRETASDLKALVCGRNQKHPSVLIDEAGFSGIKNQIKTDARLLSWHNKVMKQADAELLQPADEYEIQDGLRLLNVANSVQIKMLLFGYAYNMTGEEKYAQKAWEIMEKVCEYPDWNQDAHFLDTGVMCFAAAVFYDWFYDWTDSDMKNKVYGAAKAFAFDTAYNAYYSLGGYDNWWACTDTNWNSVCNGGVATAAMAMLEQDTDFLLDITANAARCMEYAVYETGPDGAWHEGVGYWDFFLEYLVRFLSTYDNVFAGENNFSGFKGMENFGFFGYSLSSDEGSNNFHDSTDEIYAPAAMYYLAEKTENSKLSDLKTYMTEKYSLGMDVETICFYSAPDVWENKNSSNYYRGIEAVSIKGGENELFFSAHGGETVGAHNHYDAGTFVFDILGERWAMDLGSEDYNVQNEIGKDNTYRVRSEGHNTLTVNPSNLPGQEDGFVPVTRFEDCDAAAIAVMDMSDVYGIDAVRGFYVGDNKNSLTIRDELSGTGEVYWFMHTDAEISKSGDCEYTLTKNGKSITLSYSCDAPEYSDYVAEAVPMPTSPQAGGQTPNTGVRKIAIKLALNGSANLTVKLAPAGEGIAPEPVEDKISDWVLPGMTENFDDGNVQGVFGRDESDKSLYGEKLRVDTGINRNVQGISEQISFYAAFEDKKYISVMGKKNAGANIQELGKVIEVTENGTLKVFGAVAAEKFSLLPEKWYKIDMLIKTGTQNYVSLYIDNRCFADNIPFAEADSIEEITTIYMENAYIDDYFHQSAENISVPQVVLTSLVWKYKKYMVSDKGFFTFCDDSDNISSSYLSTLGKKNIKNIVIKESGDIFNNKYLIITDANDEKIYMPVFEIGSLIYKGNGGEVDLGNNPLLNIPFTVKIKPCGEDMIFTVTADGENYEMLSIKDGNAVVAGGKKEFEGQKIKEVAFSFYPGNKECDIYINGSLILEKTVIFDSTFSRFEGFCTLGEGQEILIYTGGVNNDFRITPITPYNTGKAFGAASVYDRGAVMICADYEEGSLVGAGISDIMITPEKQVFTAESDKIFVFDSMDTLYPLTK